MNTNIVGTITELKCITYFLELGYTVSVPQNPCRYDFIIDTGDKLLKVQVKTSNSLKINKWMMTESSEKISSNNLFYVLVNMNEGQMPSYYIIPSAYVANKIKNEYEQWLKTPGKNGQKRNPTPMRTFTFSSDNEMLQYKDAWHLLGL